MAKMVGNGDWASELSRAFGEDPNKVRSIILRCAVNEAVTVTFEKYVTDSEGMPVIETIKKVAWIDEPQKEDE